MNEQDTTPTQTPAEPPSEAPVIVAPVPAPAAATGQTEKILICAGFLAVELLDKWLPVWTKEPAKEILRILSRRAGI